MLTFKNLSPILNSVDFNHPILEAYRIEKHSLNENETILFIEDLILLVIHDARTEFTGIIKWLKETRKPDAAKEVYTLNDQSYRVAANLALLTPEQEKEFKKTYHHALRQFKKAIKDYEAWDKKTQKQAIKAARKIEK